MNRYLKLGVLLFVFIPIVSISVSAQALKVGYADPEVIITYMPEYKTIQQRMAAEYQASQDALKALADDFQERVAKYQKQQPLLTAERQAQREQELAALQSEIQDSAAKKDQELSQKQDDLMAPLLSQVQSVIDQVAKTQGLDLVIRSPTLLFVNEDKIVNINLDIAKLLGIDIESEPTSN
jgi:outer membrane protein